MADKIVVSHGGHIEQVRSPLELYNHPANIFVAGFIKSPKMNPAGIESHCRRRRRGDSEYSRRKPFSPLGRLRVATTQRSASARRT